MFLVIELIFLVWDLVPFIHHPSSPFFLLRVSRYLFAVCHRVCSPNSSHGKPIAIEMRVFQPTSETTTYYFRNVIGCYHYFSSICSMVKMSDVIGVVHDMFIMDIIRCLNIYLKFRVCFAKCFAR